MSASNGQNAILTNVLDTPAPNTGLACIIVKVSNAGATVNTFRWKLSAPPTNQAVFSGDLEYFDTRAAALAAHSSDNPLVCLPVGQ